MPRFLAQKVVSLICGLSTIADLGSLFGLNMEMFPGIFYFPSLSPDFFFLLTGMEANHQFLIFWSSWIQLFI